MDINHIQLPGSLVAELYSTSLIEPETSLDSTPIVSSAKKEETVKDVEKKWKWLGENKKNIVLVVKYNDSVHLPDEHLNFLTTILTACKLSLADIALINLMNQPANDYRSVIDEFKSRIIILFDIDPATFGLPMNFPFFQIQPFANCSFLYSPSLAELEKDKVQKSKLWVSLKRLFNL